VASATEGVDVSAGAKAANHNAHAMAKLAIPTAASASHQWVASQPGGVSNGSNSSESDSATQSNGGGPELPAAAGAAASHDGGVQPDGGITWTMLEHLGHSRIAPTAASARTTSRARQVVQVMEKSAFSTVPSLSAHRIVRYRWRNVIRAVSLGGGWVMVEWSKKVLL
jgi:hypothetical protein